MDWALSLIKKYWRQGLVLLAALLVLGIARSFVSDVVSRDTYTSAKAPVFSLRYLKGSEVHEDYVDPLSPPGTPISGVAFLLPQELTKGSTVVRAVFVAEYSTAGECGPQVFLPAATTTRALKDKGVSYTMASYSYGDLTNLFQERVYVIDGSKPCTALHTILQMNPRAIANPDAPLGEQKTAVSTGDAGRWAAVLEFDAMRHSFRLQ